MEPYWEPYWEVTLLTLLKGHTLHTHHPMDLMSHSMSHSMAPQGRSRLPKSVPWGPTSPIGVP